MHIASPILAAALLVSLAGSVLIQNDESLLRPASASPELLSIPAKKVDHCPSPERPSTAASAAPGRIDALPPSGALLQQLGNGNGSRHLDIEAPTGDDRSGHSSTTAAHVVSAAALHAVTGASIAESSAKEHYSTPTKVAVSPRHTGTRVSSILSPDLEPDKAAPEKKAARSAGSSGEVVQDGHNKANASSSVLRAKVNGTGDEVSEAANLMPPRAIEVPQSFFVDSFEDNKVHDHGENSSDFHSEGVIVLQISPADEDTARAYTSMTILLIMVALVFVMLEDDYYYDEDLSEQLEEQRAREQHNRGFPALSM